MKVFFDLNPILPILNRSAMATTRLKKVATQIIDALDFIFFLIFILNAIYNRILRADQFCTKIKNANNLFV